MEVAGSTGSLRKNSKRHCCWGHFRNLLMEQARIEHAPNGSLLTYITIADAMVNYIGLFDEIYRNVFCCNPTGTKVAIWASSRENLSLAVCQQQRHRPARASAQSDQRHCYSLIGKYHIEICLEENFYSLASLCS